ncbi:MAG TPA: preprotein translocase subunit SecY, partial [Candidatus Paceibacterota bacterium]|nr:preprotein translocase subunit SecY [Candidatus Paceibacterota bacterium]
PLAALQAFGLLTILERQGVLLDLTMADRILNVVVVVTGSMILMWLGELITQYGIGNGVSLLIFAGIVGAVPTTALQLWQTFDVSQLPMYLGFIAAIIAIIAGIVVISEAERPIPITYAKQVRGSRSYGGGGSYLPIRVNNAGVMPIIFALSLLLFPQMAANFMVQSSQALIASTGSWILATLANQWIYAALYFVLVFAFTYFYSSITFDPHAISTNLQKSGAFMPGVRPGRPTADAISRIVNRLTLVGALFLGIIAMLPMVMQAITGLAALAVGGTALLIVVSVAIDFVKQVNAQISMREY